MNQALELKLLEQFKKILIEKYNYKDDQIQLAPKNASKAMDCTIIDKTKSILIGIEAKSLPNSRSDSTAFLSIFGKILKGRKLASAFAQQEGITNCEYAFLFREEDKSKFINNYSKTINKNDWDMFCLEFNVKYIYFCGEKDIEKMDVNDVNKIQ